jgi:hypothetical protein
MKCLFVLLILCGCLSKQEQQNIIDTQNYYIKETHGHIMNLHVGDKFPDQLKTYLLSSSPANARYAVKDPVPLTKSGLYELYRTFIYTIRNDTIDSIYVQYPN